jgi:hypothetical protein
MILLSAGWLSATQFGAQPGISHQYWAKNWVDLNSIGNGFLMAQLIQLVQLFKYPFQHQITYLDISPCSNCSFSAGPLRS